MKLQKKQLALFSALLLSSLTLSTMLSSCGGGNSNDDKPDIIISGDNTRLIYAEAGSGTFTFTAAADQDTQPDFTNALWTISSSDLIIGTDIDISSSGNSATVTYQNEVTDVQSAASYDFAVSCRLNGYTTGSFYSTLKIDKAAISLPSNLPATLYTNNTSEIDLGNCTVSSSYDYNVSGGTWTLENPSSYDFAIDSSSGKLTYEYNDDNSFANINDLKVVYTLSSVESKKDITMSLDTVNDITDQQPTPVRTIPAYRDVPALEDVEVEGNNRVVTSYYVTLASDTTSSIATDGTWTVASDNSDLQTIIDETDDVVIIFGGVLTIEGLQTAIANLSSLRSLNEPTATYVLNISFVYDGVTVENSVDIAYTAE